MKKLSPMQQAGSVYRVAVDSASYLLGGVSPVVDSSTELRRLGVCKACPYFDRGSGRCGVCGCNMEVKVRFRAATCPDRRWG